MPIRYRCPECQQLISIATRMAGAEVPCPQCKFVSAVPYIDQSVSLQESPAPDSPPVERPPAVATQADSPQRTPRPSRNTPKNQQEFRLRRAKTEFEDMDLTPMVDVTFLLLIFFMITASFSLQKTIEVPAPNPDSKGATQSLTLEDLEDNTVMVRIDAENGIFIDDVPLADRALLIETLSQTRLTTFRNELAIDADPAALHETVVLVIDSGTAAGMQKIRLISRSGGESED